ncbi:MAG: hypothetical protein IJK97_09185, partial [Thermoguttaceae bacterium]|nr:hypothetical protein [Thermoguttaceae bacterium]
MTQFEYSCPNNHSVKFILEMCGRTAQCPKCSARFEVPTLEEVREMLGDEITPELEKEFQEAKKKLEAHAKAKAKRAQAAAHGSSSSQLHEFEFECPNGDQVKFTLEMCGHTAKCPKGGIRFDVPKLELVREMLEGQIDDELEKEFKNAEIKYQEYLKAKALKRAQLEKEAKEKAETGKAEKEKEEEEKAAQEKTELEAKAKPERDAKGNEETAKKPPELKFTFGMEPEDESPEESPEESSEEMISFLCPNGHQLEAPVSSAGKKGKCPECGAKFKVPTMESLEETAASGELELNPESELSLDESKAAEQTKAFTEKETQAFPPKISISKDSTERPFLYPNL